MCVHTIVVFVNVCVPVSTLVVRMIDIEHECINTSNSDDYIRLYEYINQFI